MTNRLTYNVDSSSSGVLGRINRSLPSRKRANALYAAQAAVRASSRSGCSMSQLIQFSLRELVSETSYAQMDEQGIFLLTSDGCEQELQG